MEKYIHYVDSQYGYEIAKKLLEFKTIPEGFRLAGTAAEYEAGKWIADEMRQIGLKDVTIEAFPVDAWEFKGASVMVNSSERETETLRAGSFTCLEGTSEEGISGELVYVGVGTKEQYEGVDVKGKIVLVDTDSYHTYWYNALFNQAEARGAVAVVATVVGTGPGTYNDDLITTHDVMGTVKIPAVMLTKGDGDKLRSRLINGEKIIATVKSDINITPDAEAHYVYGILPGRNKNRYIIVGGHYDAYWEGFLDNATSLGTTLTMAKAMIDAGYEPESTYVFLSNGAEEYGVADTYFDFCAGSTAILKNHPEWIGNTIIYNNYELTAINQTGRFEVVCSPGCEKGMNLLLGELNIPQETFVMTMRGVGADDAIFSRAGIPSYMNVCTHFSDDGTGMAIDNKESAQNYDHTQYDNIDRYDADVFDFNNKIHGLINMSYDNMLILPIDFAKHLELFMEGIEHQTLRSLYPRYEELELVIGQLSEKATDSYEKAVEINERFINLKAVCGDSKKWAELYDLSWPECQKLLEGNKLLQENIYKYGPFSNIIQGHIQPYSYVTAIDALLDELKAGKCGSAFERLVGLDNNYMVFDFDKEVYQKIALDAFSESAPMSWGYGKTLPFPDLYDVLEHIIIKDEKEESGYKEEIAYLEKVRNEQYDILIETLDKEMKTLELISEVLSEIRFNEVLNAVKKEAEL